jgi:hypothetical protein
MDRAALQTLGQKLVDTDTIGFCRGVLQHGKTSWSPGQNLVLDGLRHSQVACALRELVKPSDFHVVLITANRDVRAARALVDLSQFTQWDEHPTEAQLTDAIPTMADLIVSGDQPLEIIVRHVLTWVRKSSVSSDSGGPAGA